jgi:hypothetical protein
MINKDKFDPPLGGETFAPANPDSYELVASSLQQLESMISNAKETKATNKTKKSKTDVAFETDVVNIIRNTPHPSNLCEENSKNENKNKRDNLAEYTQERNLDALRYMCMRDTHYDYGDDYAIMYPDYKKMAEDRAKMQEPVDQVLPLLTTTQLTGTLLDDAKKTNVGSILPKFLYKEY